MYRFCRAFPFLALVLCSCATAPQEAVPTRLKGTFNKEWDAEFSKNTSQESIATWLHGNEVSLCQVDHRPNKMQHRLTEVESTNSKKIHISCSDTLTYSELTKGCASEKPERQCLTLAEMQVAREDDYREVVSAFLKACPEVGEPVEEACLVAGRWAEKTAKPEIAKAFFLKGCSSNDGVSCGELYLLSRDAKWPETEKYFPIAVQLLKMECDSRIEVSCSALKKVVSVCPKSNSECKQASLFIAKKTADDRDRSDQQKELEQMKESVQRQAKATEGMLFQQQLQGAFRNLRTSIGTACTSTSIGSTIYTNCQ